MVPWHQTLRYHDWYDGPGFPNFGPFMLRGIHDPPTGKRFCLDLYAQFTWPPLSSQRGCASHVQSVVLLYVSAHFCLGCVNSTPLTSSKCASMTLGVENQALSQQSA
eukprot:90151-Amphidinium_carterae.1